MKRQASELVFEPLAPAFTVCRVMDYTGVDVSRPFCFTGVTNEEHSLVCPTEEVPENTEDREDGWRCFRIRGVLDFSLTGILAGIAEILASNEIGLFAVSTFNTDYIFVKEEQFPKVLSLLAQAGYSVMNGCR